MICYRCGHPVVPATPRSISAAIDQLAEGTRYEIGFPLEILPGSDPAALARSLLEDGLTRARVEGRLIDLAADGLPAPGAGEDTRVVDVIVDRLVRGNDAPGRRLDSIETAFTRGLGRCRLIVDSTARAPSCAAGGAASAGPITGSPSSGSSATTARWVPALGARDRAG